MNTASEDIKDVLVAASHGTFKATSGWGIYIGLQPDTPNTTITLMDVGGTAPGIYADRSHDPTHYPEVQIQVRGAVGGYNTAQTKIEAIETTLLGKATWDVGTVKYAGVVVVNEIEFVEFDKKKRPVWVQIVRAIREDNA